MLPPTSKTTVCGEGLVRALLLDPYLWDWGREEGQCKA